MKTQWSALFAALILGATAAAAADADRVLFDFTQRYDETKIVFTDARVSTKGTGVNAGLRVASGHRQPWPGITLPAPGGHWDLSPFAHVVLTLTNPGTNQVTVFCRVDNPGADGTDHCVTHSLALQPGQKGDLQVALKRTTVDTLAGKLSGMRGYPAGPGGSGSIDPHHVTQLVVFLGKPGADHLFELHNIRATGTYQPPTASIADADPFFPFIDTFGQYRHKDWPGKVRSLADLQSRREAEAGQLARAAGPTGWDKFGGWAAGPHLKATGFFRTEKVKGKWWLVDPDGRLFFSHGIDCVRMLDATPIDERATWFTDFPGNQPEFAPFLSHASVLIGHYAGRTPECFSFAGANLLRKYGSAWRETYPRLIHRRLRSWGLNTIGNWSDSATCRLRLTPYTDAIGSDRAKRIEGSAGYWGKFPDVFDPGFANSLRRAMEHKRGGSAGDPWCLGYFSDNEMSWGDDISLALGTLSSPSEQAAKHTFITDLQAKYAKIDQLNQAWRTRYASWDALLQSRQAPDKSRAHNDLADFYSHTAEEYFRIVREVIKSVAPNQLYLGCRFAWVNDRAAAAAAKHCDVVSYNVYRTDLADFRMNAGADVPLIIGEFHFGALDRGLFHTGLVPVTSQQARGEAYMAYVRGARRHPQFVGCHWFQYCDEPTTGRAWDGENYQIGFVDIADTPYAETIAASRQVGDHMYDGQ